MKRFTVLFGCILLVLLSCNKNQKKLNKLCDKTWVTVAEYTDGVLDNKMLWEGRTYYFNCCKLKDEKCSVTITFLTTQDQYFYWIDEKGKKFYLSFTHLGSGDEYDIEKLTKKELIVFRTTPDGVEKLHLEVLE